jgi:hypothetical protein
MLSRHLNQELSHSLHLYNGAMRAAYAWQTKQLRTGNKPYEGSLHLAVKKRFQLDDYYANSAVQQANALRTSQKELQVLYLKQVDVTIQSIRKKLKNESRKLTALRNMKHIRSITGQALILPYVYFTYGQDQVQESIATQLSCQNKKKYGKPIGWSIEDHGTYYIIKCIVEEPEHHFAAKTRRIELQNGGCIGARTSQHV